MINKEIPKRERERERERERVGTAIKGGRERKRRIGSVEGRERIGEIER